MTSCVLFRAEKLRALGESAGPILGIETGTSSASLAVVARGRVLAEGERDVASHGASLPAEVEAILRGAGLGFGELAAIAIGIGPGSFTGLRVGLSYAKGLALALQRPIVGVPSLDAVALSAVEAVKTSVSTTVCPVLDARKGEVYAALYRVVPDGLEKVSDDLVVSLEWLISRVSGEVVFAGDRRAADAQFLIDARGGRATHLTGSQVSARARFIAAIAASRLARAESDQMAGLEPLYVRSPEATLRAAEAAAGREGLWSRGNSNLSSNTQITTKN